eukprot:1215318-Rhodomonas_salina.2
MQSMKCHVADHEMSRCSPSNDATSGSGARRGVLATGGHRYAPTPMLLCHLRYCHGAWSYAYAPMPSPVLPWCMVLRPCSYAISITAVSASAYDPMSGTMSGTASAYAPPPMPLCHL